MVSFDNTENAFKAKSNIDLRRSFLLFKIIGNPYLVRIGSIIAPIALKIGFKSIIKKTIFKQFVGGENISDCLQTIEALGNFNIGTILDYSVEGKEDEKDFDNCCKETIETIERARNDKNIPFCVFKVTGLGRFALLEKVSAMENLLDEEQQEYQRIKDRVNKICSSAYNSNKPLFIDAEESWIQLAVDEMADENMKNFNKKNAIIYNTFQLYRKDRYDFLVKSFLKAKSENYIIGAKLVRGAYMEKERKRAIEKNYPSPIQKNKQDSDFDFDKSVEFCIKNIKHFGLCAGTHNEESSMKLIKLMENYKIEKNDKRIYFSQLLGMSDHISYNLTMAGFNVAKYVPYGPVNDVLPYLMRRARENTSVKGMTGRELSLLIKENKRRRLIK